MKQMEKVFVRLNHIDFPAHKVFYRDGLNLWISPEAPELRMDAYKLIEKCKRRESVSLAFGGYETEVPIKFISCVLNSHFKGDESDYLRVEEYQIRLEFPSEKYDELFT